MGKIKLNLVSGAIVEKPLISAFKANNNSYVVLDNEINGSMGLPIILVCKLENSKLTKIVDQAEWQIVKEYLKNIIAGNKIEFFNVDSELTADDIYYTQLTLPVPSFDALKNAYKIEDNTDATGSLLDINTEPFNDMSNPQMGAQSVMPNVEPVTSSIQTPVTETPVMDSVVTPSSPVIDINNPSQVNMSTPNNDTPVIDLNIPMPTFGNPVNETPVSSQVIQPEVTPNNEAPIINNEVNIFKEQKDAFMQACENMFDALVQKFEKELENRK